MAKKNVDTNLTMSLDELEGMLIKTVIPFAHEVKEQLLTESDQTDEELARELITKLGARMMFGKEIFDKVYKKTIKENNAKSN